MEKTYFETHRGELSGTLQEMLGEFLNYPTATGYHHLKNKLAEYYGLAQPYYEKVYKTNQEQMRAELGIGQEG